MASCHSIPHSHPTQGANQPGPLPDADEASQFPACALSLLPLFSPAPVPLPPWSPPWFFSWRGLCPLLENYCPKTIYLALSAPLPQGISIYPRVSLFLVLGAGPCPPLPLHRMCVKDGEGCCCLSCILQAASRAWALGCPSSPGQGEGSAIFWLLGPLPL